jgi:4-amino-4-deoxy-L-arabinose transferase-like glycosyltransferase
MSVDRVPQPVPNVMRPFAILGLFVAVNATLAVFTVEGAALKFGGDASSWYEPALGLLKHGDFVVPDDPSRYLTARPPLYPMFAAGLLWLSGGAMWSVVIGQLTLLFATGWVSRTMTETCLPGYGDAMLALVIFNPNALGSAHLFQSDTLYAFLIAAVIAALFFYARAPAWRWAIACGMAFGLSLLTRNTGQFLLYVWPLAFLLLATLARGAVLWRSGLAMGAASLVVALLVTVPWQLHNQRAGEGLSLTTNYLKSYFLWDNISYLEKYDKNIGQSEAERAAEARRNAFAAEYGPGFDKLSDADRFAYLEKRGREQFFSYPPRAYVQAFGWAWVQYYGIPGVSNFMNLLGLGEETAFARYRNQRYDNYLQAGLDALRNASPAFVLLTAIGFLFVIVVRLLGLLGVVTLLRRRLWAILVIVGAGLGYFTLVHLFVANSRYRLPIEPLLFLLALYGLDGWRRRSVTS